MCGHIAFYKFYVFCNRFLFNTNSFQSNYCLALRMSCELAHLAIRFSDSILKLV